MPKQINENLQEIDANDEYYTRTELNELFIPVIKSFVSDSSWDSIQKIDNKIKVDYEGEELLFFVNNFLWVGEKNPENKKRIVISLNSEEERKLYQRQLFLIGVYHFGKVNVFGLCEIGIKKRDRKWNTSSVMWIKTEELRNALLNGYEKKNSNLGITHLFKDLKDLFTYLFQIKRNGKPKIEITTPVFTPQPTKPIPTYQENNWEFFKLEKKEFNLEEEIHNILENNLTTIFSNLTFLKRKWPIPRYKEYEEQEKIDTLAFHHEQIDKWKNFVLLEYKWKSKQESPIDQVIGYHQNLRDDSGNFDALKGILEDYLEEKLNWKYHKSFWDKFILICIAPFGYYESSLKIKRQVKGLDQYKIKVVLIEIQKYDDDAILISFFKDENREKYMKLLGVDFHKIIISRKRDKN